MKLKSGVIIAFGILLMIHRVDMLAKMKMVLNKILDYYYHFVKKPVFQSTA